MVRLILKRTRHSVFVDDGDPDALTDVARAACERGDAALAIALHRTVLRAAPRHRAAIAGLAAAQAAIVSPANAARSYAEAIAREPLVAMHHGSVGAPERFAGMEAVEELVRAALAADPAHARAHAALGNIAARRADRDGAMAAYARAVMLDWDFADAHLALAQLYDTGGAPADATRHLTEALLRRRWYTAAAARASRRVLLLKLPGGLLANGLIDYCIDTNRTDLDVFYVTPDTVALPDLAGYSAVFSVMSAASSRRAEIAHAVTLLEAVPVRVINHPRRLAATLRAALPAVLAGVPGCVVPRALELARDDMRAATLPEFPILVRPIDTHRGDGLERVDDRAQLAAYLDRVEAQRYDLTPFVDYRSCDGYYRKYRVVVVDGVPYPYHLALSTEWLVHYWRVTAAMSEHAWMRAEEERFLREPASVFPTWTTTFAAIAAALELDYFCVDCAVAANGDVLVFECDSTAFVHCREARDGPFAYKFDYVPAIFAALDALLDAR